MITCKEEAERWVHLYAAGGVVFASVPLPFSTAPILATLETHLMTMIGSIYGEPMGAAATAAAGGTFHVLGSGLKFAVAKATTYVPIVGPLIRGLTAAATIEAIGQGIIAHYERKYPGKLFTQVSKEQQPNPVSAPAAGASYEPTSRAASASSPAGADDNIFTRRIKVRGLGDR
ncbi:MAG: hypothetical protein U0271_00825 [Polyangiaceae bacterium]